MKAENLIQELSKLATPERAQVSQRFFKTGPGEYGEGDIFIGVSMPDLRKVCKQFITLPITELKKLVDSPAHEHRMAGLVICTNKFKKADETERAKLYEFYMDALKRGKVNNWDLVDVTCPGVVGEYLIDKPRGVLYELVASKSLWDRRAAVLATFAFVKMGESLDILKISELLINDSEDLIHKAVGWMLREMGKRVGESELCEFLDKNAHKMPRTMLRYAIEKLDDSLRLKYMKIV